MDSRDIVDDVEPASDDKQAPKSAGKGDGQGAPDDRRRPVLYRECVALDSDVHAGLSLKQVSDFKYAARADYAPLLVEEFAQAKSFYPIVFTSTTPVGAAAILGVAAERNLFVDEEGNWEQDCYVPAYVRRYPFITAPSPKEKDQWVLCIDPSSDRLVEDGSRPLFEKGEPTEVLESAKSFCQAYLTGERATLEFCEALEKHKVLTERNVLLRTADRESERQVGGFRTIDEAKFKELDDDVLLEWRRREWLALVYAHFASMDAWRGILQRWNTRKKGNANDNQ